MGDKHQHQWFRALTGDHNIDVSSTGVVNSKKAIPFIVADDMDIIVIQFSSALQLYVVCDRLSNVGVPTADEESCSIRHSPLVTKLNVIHHVHSSQQKRIVIII